MRGCCAGCFRGFCCCTAGRHKPGRVWACSGRCRMLRASLRNRLMKCSCALASAATFCARCALRVSADFFPPTRFSAALVSARSMHAVLLRTYAGEKKEPAPQLRDAARVPPLGGPRPTPSSRRLFPAALSLGEITLACRSCPTWCRILPFIIVAISHPPPGSFFFPFMRGSRYCNAAL